MKLHDEDDILLEDEVIDTEETLSEKFDNQDVVEEENSDIETASDEQTEDDEGEDQDPMAAIAMIDPSLSVKSIIEALLLAADQPMTPERIRKLFDLGTRPELDEVKEHLEAISDDCLDKGYELKKIGKGYQLYVRPAYAHWVSKLREEKPPKYSRAFLETLALVAYRQPITRGEIEAVRGVAVSTHIMRTLEEHGWVRVVGHKEVPGRPAMFATTKQFLEYFSLESLQDLPTLAQVRDLDMIASDNNIDIADLELNKDEVDMTGLDDVDEEVDTHADDLVDTQAEDTEQEALDSADQAETASAEDAAEEISEGDSEDESLEAQLQEEDTLDAEEDMIIYQGTLEAETERMREALEQAASEEEAEVTQEED